MAAATFVTGVRAGRMGQDVSPTNSSRPPMAKNDYPVCLRATRTGPGEMWMVVRGDSTEVKDGPELDPKLWVMVSLGREGRGEGVLY